MCTYLVRAIPFSPALPSQCAFFVFHPSSPMWSSYQAMSPPVSKLPLQLLFHLPISKGSLAKCQCISHGFKAMPSLCQASWKACKVQSLLKDKVPSLMLMAKCQCIFHGFKAMPSAKPLQRHAKCMQSLLKWCSWCKPKELNGHFAFFSCCLTIFAHGYAFLGATILREKPANPSMAPLRAPHNVNLSSRPTNRHLRQLCTEIVIGISHRVATCLKLVLKERDRKLARKSQQLAKPYKPHAQTASISTTPMVERVRSFKDIHNMSWLKLKNFECYI